MKLATYIIGTLSAMLVVIGILFKVQHWPKAGVVFSIGFGILGLIFIPIFAIYHYRKTT